MTNYLVVLFKNKKRKRIIKKFITFKKTKLFFDTLVDESENVLFPILVEGRNECTFELGIVELSSKQLVPIYMTDEYGRNVKVKLEDDGMTLVKIIPYKIEELIHDNQTNKKTTLPLIIKKYLKGKELKMVYSLNNRIIIQEEEKIFLFTLKNKSESVRLLDCLTNYFFKIKRGDCIFNKDVSTPQKKYLYQLLESKGFSKTKLYRRFT